MTKRATVWVAAIVGTAAVLAGLVVASGMRFYTVMTPSMGQVAPVGTLVITRPATDYTVGDVVTYERKDRSYTHRIVTASADGTFTTKGDLNGAPDPLPVEESQIIGRVVWIGPGLGWLWQGLPWLALGGLAVYAVSLLRRFDLTWRWVLRFSGWTLTFCLVAFWLRPWVNLAQLSWVPAGTGVDMHVVNTGLFPLDVLGNRLVSGQDAVVHVVEKNANGYYTLTPGLAFQWWEQVGLFLLCLIPLALSFLIRDDTAAPPTRALTVPGEGEEADPAADVSTPQARPAGPSRRRLVLTGAVTLAIIASVAVVTFSATASALTARIQNSTDTAGTRTFFNCRNAISSASGSPYVAWALGTAQSTGTNETDLSGNSRSGRYMVASSTSSSIGCLRDTPAASVTFNGSSQCLFMNANYATYGYYPTTFSLEAWFRTSTKSNGKIIGFGNSRNSASDGTYDRHIYLDKDGRIVFGVYPNVVKLVYTAAGTSYADGKWHHVVGTLSGSTQSLYVDGAPVMSQTVPSPYAEQAHGYWKVGCGNLSGWQNAATAASGSGALDYDGPSYFTGQIQYAAVYSVALTAAQVKEHYQAGQS